jgi:hypothetical protein
MLRDRLARRIHRLTALFEVSAPGERLDGATRSRFETSMRVARDRLDAADILGRPPHRAESIHVLSRALEALEEAVLQIAPVAPADVWPADFAPTTVARSLRSARESLDTAPGNDGELSREDLAAARSARSAAGRVHSRLQRVTRDRRTAIRRRLAGLAALAVVLSGGFWVSRLHDRFQAAASGAYLPLFDAARAVDGDPATEWLAPDGVSAWLELRFARQIDVKAVTVINAHNHPFNDRATKHLDVELYRDNQLLTRAQATFDQIEAASTARSIPVEAKGVTRVRFVARDFHGKGAGFAEVEVIEAPH